MARFGRSFPVPRRLHAPLTGAAVTLTAAQLIIDYVPGTPTAVGNQSVSVQAVPLVVQFIPGTINAGVGTLIIPPTTVLDFVPGTPTVVGNQSGSVQAVPTILDVVIRKAAVAAPVQINAALVAIDWLPGASVPIIGNINAPVDTGYTANANTLLQFLRTVASGGNTLSGSQIGSLSGITNDTFHNEFQQYQLTVGKTPAIIGLTDLYDYTDSGTWTVDGVPIFDWTRVVQLTTYHASAGGILSYTMIPPNPTPTGGHLNPYTTALSGSDQTNATPLQWGPAAAAILGFGSSVAQTQSNKNLNALLDQYAQMANLIAYYGIPFIFRLFPENNLTSTHWYDRQAWSAQLFQYCLGYLSGTGGFSGQPVTAVPAHNMLYMFCNSTISGLGGWPASYSTIDFYSIDHYGDLSGHVNLLKNNLQNLATQPGYSHKVPAVAEIFDGGGSSVGFAYPYLSAGVDISTWTIGSPATVVTYVPSIINGSNFPSTNGTFSIATTKGVYQVNYSTWTAATGTFTGCVAQGSPAAKTLIMNDSEIICYDTANGNDNADILTSMKISGASHFMSWYTFDNLLFQPNLSTLMNDSTILDIGDYSLGYATITQAPTILEIKPSVNKVGINVIVHSPPTIIEYLPGNVAVGNSGGVTAVPTILAAVPGTASIAAPVAVTSKSALTEFIPGFSVVGAPISQVAGFPVSVSNGGSPFTTMSVSWARVGDLAVLNFSSMGDLLTTVTSPGVSGGWTLQETSPPDGFGVFLTTWTGIVTSTGTDTLTFAFSSSPSGANAAVVTELTTGDSTFVWSIVAVGGAANTASSSVNQNWPTISTGPNIPEAWVGGSANDAASTYINYIPPGTGTWSPLYQPSVTPSDLNFVNNFGTSLSASTPYTPSIGLSLPTAQPLSLIGIIVQASPPSSGAVTASPGVVEFIRTKMTVSTPVFVQAKAALLDFVPGTTAVGPSITINATPAIVEAVPSVASVGVGTLVPAAPVILEVLPSTAVLTVPLTMVAVPCFIDLVPGTPKVSVAAQVTVPATILEALPGSITQAAPVRVTARPTILAVVPGTASATVTIQVTANPTHVTLVPGPNMGAGTNANVRTTKTGFALVPGKASVALAGAVFVTAKGSLLDFVIGNQLNVISEVPTSASVDIAVLPQYDIIMETTW